MRIVVKAEAKIIFMGSNETPGARESQHIATQVKSITRRLLAETLSARQKAL
jgi:hypothetical protein